MTLRRPGRLGQGSRSAETATEPSCRQAAGQRYALRRLPAAPSPDVRLRLGIFRDELARAQDEKDAAKLMLILAEGVHEGVFRAVEYVVRRPLIMATIEVDGPPHLITLRTTMPLTRSDGEIRRGLGKVIPARIRGPRR